MENGIFVPLEQKREESLDDESEMMIIGGAMIYAQALALTQRLYLTYIHQKFTGDAFFPKYQEYHWNELYSKSQIKKDVDSSHEMRFDFLILEKKV